MDEPVVIGPCEVEGCPRGATEIVGRWNLCMWHASATVGDSQIWHRASSGERA